MTIRIRYRLLNARLAAGAVSAGQGGGVDQTYDGWRGVSQLNFSNGVESGHSLKPPERRQYAQNQSFAALRNRNRSAGAQPGIRPSA